MKNKVVIVGCGNVGMSYAYALLNQKTPVGEIVLIDLNADKIIGEMMDLNHCLAFAPSKIKISAGNYQDCQDADIVCLAAGANQEPNETRMDLIYKNTEIFSSIITNVMNSGFNGIFLVATNPLDVMTYMTYKLSKLPAYRVIGSGTTLDTARLRYVLAERLGINPKNVHAYVMGEHGDSEFVPWSSANVGLINIHRFLQEEELVQIETEVKNAAYEIIKRKGATYYGIGMCLVRITNAILGDENTILTVSTYDKEHDIYISSPAIINRQGIKGNAKLTLTEEEQRRLADSVHTIKEAITTINDKL
ncbi:MAG: L-lactate dehydrogenase [Bacilli bacterium]|jgi:L-lactate dehydrogenase|nr:L-lactate dehydrogenase [Bacilli bacterium]